jgi:hypothetical protein
MMAPMMASMAEMMEMIPRKTEIHKLKDNQKRLKKILATQVYPIFDLVIDSLLRGAKAKKAYAG